MSNVSIFNQEVPDFLRGAELNDLTKSLAGGGAGGKRISIRGGVFRKVVGGEEVGKLTTREMNVIIINARKNVSRVFYAGKYNPDEIVPPSCFSNEGDVPDPSAEDKQSTSCATCPQNISGSGEGTSRACRYQQRLAVVLDGEVDKEEVYQLVLPPTSVFGDGEKGKLPLQAYARHLKNHGTPITGVVTEMRFDTASPTPKLVFKPVRPVSEEEFEIIQTLKDSSEATAAITLTVAQTDGVKDKPKLGFAKPAQKAEEAEVVEEPKKAAPKKAAVTAEPKLEDLVGEWDDA